MHVTLHPRLARASLALALLLLFATPLRAQVDLEATVLDVEDALSFDGETAVVQLGSTVTIRFTVAHIAGTSFQNGDEFNTTAGVPPAQSNILRKQTMTSDSESVPCSLAGCTGRIASGDTVAFAVTALAESEGTATFTITTEPNLRSDVNFDNNIREFTVVVVDNPQADLQLRIPMVTGALSYDPENGTAELPLNRPVAFEIEVHNLGPGSATSVIVTGGTDPSVVVFDSVTAVEGGPCEFDVTGGSFTCGPLTMAPMDTLTVSVAGKGVSARTAPTLFSASTGHPNDPDFSNNDALFEYIVSDAPTTNRFTGTVYFDIDGDGVQDLPDDQGLEGQVVFVDLNANGFYDPGTDTSDVTIADGTFVLEIPPVDEPVNVGGMLTDGWEWTVPADGFQTVGEGGAEGVDFGTRPRNSAILGAVWDDVDGDGQVGPDEPRLEGWRVYADLNGNGVFDVGEPSDLSDSSGLYIIPDLAAGTYMVRQVPQAGFAQTFPERAHTVTLGADEYARGRNFSNTRLGTIHGQVFDDADGDSTRAPGEAGLDSVRVVLRDSTGAVVDSTTTMSMDLDGDGALDPTTERGLYWFENLTDGAYTVEMRNPDGFRQTSPRSKKHQIVISRTEGRTAQSVDFGTTQLGVISGYVWDYGYDMYSGEHRYFGENGVDVELVDAETGAVVAVTRPMGTVFHPQSGFNLDRGRYEFTVMPSKTYLVRVSDRENYVLDHPEGPYRVTVGPGEHAKRFNFIYHQREPVSISGRKVDDPRGDARRFAWFEGFQGLNGWTIRIAGLNNSLRAETTTTDIDLDGDGMPEAGAYRFDDLPEGTYLVTEVEREGFRKTFPGLPFYTVIARGGEVSRVDFANQLILSVPVNDTGDGDSLRTAIEGCNALPPEDPPCRIQLGGNGNGGGKRAAVTIRPDRPLPPLTRPVVIDGGGDTVIDGADAGEGAHGLVVTAGYSDIRGLTITNFSGHGMLLNGPGGNRIEDNRLTANGGSGIRIATDTLDLFLGNVITANGGPAIDLGAPGPTPNDVGETDGVQNHPVITAVSTDTGLVVEGTLSSTHFRTFTLEFFAAETCGAAGQGYADLALGRATVVIDSLLGNATADGQVGFTVRFDTAFSRRHFITATATDFGGGTSELSPCTSVARTTALDPAVDALPAAFRLHANYPNPFNPTTTIRFEVPERERVRLHVYNVLGQVVATLVDETLLPGLHTAVFDAEHLPSGVYYYRLTTGGSAQTRSMVLLR